MVSDVVAVYSRSCDYDRGVWEHPPLLGTATHFSVAAMGSSYLSRRPDASYVAVCCIQSLSFLEFR